jgi:hypothetical protein
MQSFHSEHQAELYLGGVLTASAVERAQAELAAAQTPSNDGGRTLNLSRVRAATPEGLRRWVGQADRWPTRLAISECSYELGLHAQTIDDLFRNIAVKSCIAPYFCVPCGASRHVEVGAHELGQDGTPPGRSCGSCGGAMEFDELDDYLTFMRKSA